MSAQLKLIEKYEKGLRDQQRIDQTASGIPYVNLPILDNKEEILEKWRRLTHNTGHSPVDAGVWEIQNGRHSTTGVSAFTPVQQAIVISCLIHCEPHREIARLLQHLETPEPSEVNEAYQGIIEDESIILPEGMSQAEYEERVIKRCKDYVSNKKRKPYQIIQAGREEYSEQIVKWVIAEINYMQNLMIQEIVDKYRELDIKDALELADKTYEMREAFFALLFDEEEDTGEVAVDEDATYAVTDPPASLTAHRGYRYYRDCLMYRTDVNIFCILTSCTAEIESVFFFLYCVRKSISERYLSPSILRSSRSHLASKSVSINVSI